MASIFDGWWRPDPHRYGPDAPVVELVVGDGRFGCRSCRPPYEVPTDGEPHPVAGQDGFDSLAVTILDPRSLRRVARLRGRLVLDATATVGGDGSSSREVRLIANQEPHAVRMVAISRRVGEGAPGMHGLAGSWQPVEADLMDHEEDTEYRIAHGILRMRDRFGRSFDASLDGRPAPYRGDSRYTVVTVRWLDDRTIEETDLHDDEPVQVLQWRVEPDGVTMHVRFDDLHGRVMEQEGHRLP